MVTTAEQIDIWRQAPSEHQRLEFKEAKNQFDSRKLNEYCVALANEGGGTLLLGIADKAPRAVVSTRAFPDLIESPRRCSMLWASGSTSRPSRTLTAVFSCSMSHRGRVGPRIT